MTEIQKLRALLRTVKRHAPTDEPPAPEDILMMIRSRQHCSIADDDEIDVTTFLQNLSKKK